MKEAQVAVEDNNANDAESAVIEIGESKIFGEGDVGTECGRILELVGSILLQVKFARQKEFFGQHSSMVYQNVQQCGWEEL